MGTVSELEAGGRRYIVKELTPQYGYGGLPSLPMPGFSPEELVLQAENEAVKAAISRLLGHPAPEVACKLIYENGKITSVRLAFPKINGKPLSELSTGEVYNLRKALSEDTAISYVLGDFDRKADNYILEAFSRRPIPIDAGCANVRNAAPTRSGDPASLLETLGENASFFHGPGLNHHFNRSSSGMLGRDPIEAAKAAKINMAQRALTYDDAKPMLDKIINLFRAENRGMLENSLRRAYEKVHGKGNPAIAGFCRDTIDYMQQRLQAADATLRTLNRRSGRSLPP